MESISLKKLRRKIAHLAGSSSTSSHASGALLHDGLSKSGSSATRRHGCASADPAAKRTSNGSLLDAYAPATHTLEHGSDFDLLWRTFLNERDAYIALTDSCGRYYLSIQQNAMEGVNVGQQLALFFGPEHNSFRVARSFGEMQRKYVQMLTAKLDALYNTSISTPLSRQGETMNVVIKLANEREAALKKLRHCEKRLKEASKEGSSKESKREEYARRSRSATEDFDTLDNELRRKLLEFHRSFGNVAELVLHTLSFIQAELHGSGLELLSEVLTFMNNGEVDDDVDCSDAGRDDSELSKSRVLLHSLRAENAERLVKLGSNSAAAAQDVSGAQDPPNYASDSTHDTASDYPDREKALNPLATAASVMGLSSSSSKPTSQSTEAHTARHERASSTLEEYMVVRKNSTKYRANLDDMAMTDDDLHALDVPNSNDQSDQTSKAVPSLGAPPASANGHGMSSHEPYVRVENERADSGTLHKYDSAGGGASESEGSETHSFNNQDGEERHTGSSDAEAWQS
ncbi:hypothetical protein FVE85_4309 [Porphyridium purpureum]|uniref:Uncharacterized protein n=1 Tax=Porphyridium purpureum TaxID=35688 RepID=A0A5J4YUF5_PORPP|nr:hypothetical protein FVE85_4309 [Porphyridium purpureum]|eukprot:POR7381..scf229_5